MSSFVTTFSRPFKCHAFSFNYKTLIQELRDDGWEPLLASVISFCEQHEIDILDMNACYTKGCERPRSRPVFYMMFGQTLVNGWSRIVASQNGGSTDYISPLRLGVLQWSRHLFNYLDK